ncbi:MAG: rod shape-determining protein MreC [Clostridia bacterium]|nr:rod shape-determining protein MreC [Clostridia bacterium]
MHFQNSVKYKNPKDIGNVRLGLKKTLSAMLIITVITAFTGFVSGNGKLIVSYTRAFLTPIFSVTSSGINRVLKLKDYFRTVDYYKRENFRLKSEVEELEHSLMEVSEYKQKIRRLEAILGLKKQIVQTNSVLTVKVVANNQNKEIIINKGAESGISNGNTVLSGTGLVGRVKEAGKGYSVVETVLNEEFSVAVRNTRNDRLDILEGDGEGLCILSVGEDICPGDIFETTGSAGVYPEGVRVGKVDKITSGSGRTVAEVKPYFNAEALPEVLVIIQS